MLMPVIPLLTGLLQESTPQDIPMPSGAVLLLIFFALVFVVAWRLIVNRSEAPLLPAESRPAAHQTPPLETRAQPVEIAGDDLTLLEGIGPHIQKLLNENGIHTFTELAETSPEFLNELLRAHRLPGVAVTWPEQARLAALGDWDGLKTLQENLTAGRRP
jgi:predicted flap endonuclease-1-like 5' DNA nuclease